ncbi:MAG: hypothetical protein SFW67_21995 [Myxococcaceae bacterium]|nr:hypothetical protein [Myxococcaceae bacterium]
MPPAEAERIARSTSITAKQFAEAVLRAEGDDSSAPSDALVEKIAARFIAAVGSSELPSRPADEEA